MAGSSDQVRSVCCEAVADARVAERVQEVNARLDELGKRIDDLVSARSQRQDATVQALDIPTFETVANALAAANELGAIVDGHLRVQASRDRDELGLDFSWITVKTAPLSVRREAGSPVRLGSDQTVAFQDSPHGCDRGHPVDLADQVMGDGIRPGIVTGLWPGLRTMFGESRNVVDGSGALRQGSRLP